MLKTRSRGDEDGTRIQPSARTVMNAWARSNEPDMAEQYENLLKRMVTEG